MKKLDLATTAFLGMIAIDVGFCPVLSAMIGRIAGLAFWPTFAIYALVLAAGVVATWPLFVHLLRPSETLHRRVDSGRRIRSEDLRMADARLYKALSQLPQVVGARAVVAPGATVALYAVLVGPIGLQALAVPVVGLVMAAVAAGVAVLYPLMYTWLLSGAGRRNYRLARTLHVDLERPERPIGKRLAVTALCLTLTPLFLLTATALSVKVDASHDSATRDARALAAELALQPPDQVFAPVAESADVVVAFVLDAGSVRVAHDKPLPPWASAKALALAADGQLSPPDRQVALDARRLDDGRVVGTIVRMAAVDTDFLVLLVSVLVTLGGFGPLAAFLFTRSLSDPLRDAATSARRIVERGDLDAMDDLASALNDEVGVVTDHFNGILDSMRSIAAAAGEVGRGKLDIEMEGRGDLPDSFRAMLEQLRKLVGEMYSTSSELASAATEISAASQEQEAATTSHSTGMTEISQTMDSLSDSASHVAKSVQGVLENAERTLQNTDQMVARIDDLTGHANRIGDILDVIREIADRTDLLALNGSLEASRAGEAGVGFSLVASEMRRLAERVTGSVGDIKQLVSDIRESGASTVVATEESRKLAEGTTEAARSITLVTQQQRSSTEQVSQNVRSVAEIMQQSATSTAQTRASAESLKEQADRLAELVARFDL